MSKWSSYLQNDDWQPNIGQQPPENKPGGLFAGLLDSIVDHSIPDTPDYIPGTKPGFIGYFGHAMQEGTKDVVRSTLGFGEGLANKFAKGSKGPGTAIPPQYGDDAERLFQNAAYTIQDMKNSNSLKPDERVERPKSLIGGYAYDVARQAPQIISQVGAGVMGGAPASVATMFSQIAGGDYNNLTGQGVEPERALQAGIVDAALQTPLEQFALNKFSKIFRGGSLVKNAAVAGASEGITEWLQQYPQDAAELWAKNPNMSSGDMAKSYIDNIGETTKEGLYSGLVTMPYSLLGAGASGIHRRLNRNTPTPSMARTLNAEQQFANETSSPMDDTSFGDRNADIQENNQSPVSGEYEHSLITESGDLRSIINEAADAYGVPPELIAAVIKHESGFNQEARSGVGAIGLMQLMPGTAEGLGVNPYDARENVMGGTKYLKEQLEAFGGDVEKALAAYNAGPGAVQEYGGVPPYKETQNYVHNIMGSLGDYSLHANSNSQTQQAQRNINSLLDQDQTNYAAAEQVAAKMNELLENGLSNDQLLAVREFAKDKISTSINPDEVNFLSDSLERGTTGLNDIAKRYSGEFANSIGLANNQMQKPAQELVIQEESPGSRNLGFNNKSDGFLPVQAYTDKTRLRERQNLLDALGNVLAKKYDNAVQQSNDLINARQNLVNALNATNANKFDQVEQNYQERDKRATQEKLDKAARSFAKADTNTLFNIADKLVNQPYDPVLPVVANELANRGIIPRAVMEGVPLDSEMLELARQRMMQSGLQPQGNTLNKKEILQESVVNSQNDIEGEQPTNYPALVEEVKRSGAKITPSLEAGILSGNKNAIKILENLAGQSVANPEQKKIEEKPLSNVERDAQSELVSQGHVPKDVDFTKEVELNPDQKAGIIKDRGSSQQSAPLKIADWILDKLSIDEKITIDELFKIANEAYGGTQAEGHYTVKDAYDCMELGVNKFILKQEMFSHADVDDIVRANKVIGAIKSHILSNLPTQTKRTKEQIDFQQFSTPPQLAYAVAWAAKVSSSDTVLEPSAGIGGLATFAKATGANVVVNELSLRRAEILKEVGFNQVYTENAEQIDNILPDNIKPSVVIMNPPFSSTAGRIKGKNDTKNATVHMEQALNRLEPNGRLVAIVGRGMSDNASSFQSWWKKIKTEYNIRANIGIDGKEYTKYGTNFGIQLVVIDKTGPTTRPTVTGNINSISEILPILEGIRNDRIKSETDRSTKQAASNQFGGKDVAAQSRGKTGGLGNSASRLQANGVGNGERTGSTESREQMGAVGSQGNAGKDNVSGESQKSNGSDNTLSGYNGRQHGTHTESNERAEEPLRRSLDSSRPIGHESGRNVERSEIKIESKNNKVKHGEELSDSTFDDYKPQKLQVPGAQQHPTKLVQSAAMATVEPPKPTYTPKLPNKLIKDGDISIAQLESTVYAGQAHEQLLPDGTRKGFFIGDGTGVGKGREIASIIIDNFNKGRTKAVWLSKNAPLFDDAVRDLTDLGFDEKLIFPLNKFKPGDEIGRNAGVMFLPYTTLSSGLEYSNQDEAVRAKDNKSRIDQVVNWLGKDFDGALIFDEAHMMQNCLSVKGARGNTKPALKALAGVALQNRLPNARVVYVSATGATEIENLGYAKRLALWGEGTPFANVGDFVAKIKSSGIAAMELVARDMKALGSYIARNLSYDGVTYGTITHKLTSQQREIYDTMAEGWQVVLKNINEALRACGAIDQHGKTLNADAKKNAMGAFWGAQQRFFNQILTSMQMPSVVEDVKKQIASGNAVVMQLVNTNEATQDRAIANREEDTTLEELDLTPRDILLQYLDNAFPTNQYEQYTDEDGNIRSRIVVDSKGNPVQNRVALQMKEDLMRKLGSMKVPDGPLEIIINTFGTKSVAEVTGRKRRVVKERDEVGRVTAKIETRSKSHTKADVKAFLDNKKDILIFSEAGGTGQSFHAGQKMKNQRRRIHYLIQPGWKADSAVQGFGRTHRSGEVSQPHYVLVTTELKGQKRFISTIARRLDQLGALTKGQRDAATQGLFSAKDNLESDYARDALQRFYNNLKRNAYSDLDTKGLLEKMGLSSLIEEDESKSNKQVLKQDIMRDIPKFLNRLLTLQSEEQNRVFDYFYEILDNIIDSHIANGTLETGMENYRAQGVTVNSEKVVYSDEKSGAETKYVELEAKHKNIVLSYEDVESMRNFIGIYKNVKSGKIWAAKRGAMHTDDYGRVHNTLIIQSPSKSKYRSINESELSPDGWIKLSSKDGKVAWNEAVKSEREYVTEKLHMITGAILPIWDKLPDNQTRVLRVQSDDGRRFLGRLLKERDIDSTLKKLGAKVEYNYSNNEIKDKILNHNYTVELSNGWKLKRSRVSGENRIELVGNDLWKYNERFEKRGIFNEQIQWKTRYFLPIDKFNTIFEGFAKDRNAVVDVIPGANSVKFSADKISKAGHNTPSDQVIEQQFDIRFIAQNKINTEEKSIFELGKQMGVPVRFFVGQRGLRGFHADGITYINRNGNRGIEWAFWHEGLHWMKAMDQGLYNHILDEVQQSQIITPKQIADYRNTIKLGNAKDEHGNYLMSDNDIIEEMFGDEAADAAKRMKLFKTMQETNPGLFSNLVEWFKNAIAKFKRYLSGSDITSIDRHSKLTAEQVKVFENGLRQTLLSLKDTNGKRLFENKEEFPFKELPANYEVAPQFSNDSSKHITPLDIQVEITDIKPTFSGRDWRDLRKSRNFPKDIKDKLLSASPITNKQNGWKIHITKGTIDHLLNSSRGGDIANRQSIEHYEIVPAIPELLEKAVLVESHSDSHGRAEIKQVHRLYAPAKINGDLLSVKFTVIEYEDGKLWVNGLPETHKLYDHSITNKIPAGTSQTLHVLKDNVISGPAAGISTISLGEMLGEVNDNNVKFSSDVENIESNTKQAIKNMITIITKENPKKKNLSALEKFTQATMPDIASVNIVAKWHPQLKQFFKLGTNAVQTQEKLRQIFQKRLSAVDKALGGRNKILSNSKEFNENKVRLNEILLLGDMDEKTYTASELKELGANDAIIKGYKLIRSAYQHAWSVLNNARQSIETKSENMSKDRYEKLKASKFVTILSFSQNDKGEYLVTWKQPKLFVQTKTVTGSELNSMLKDPNIEVEQDSIRPFSFSEHVMPESKGMTYGDGYYTVSYKSQKPALGNREGYIPHFFHDYFITTKEGGIIGTGRTLREATKIADEFVKKNPKTEITIRPKQYEFPGAAVNAAILGDKDYAKMVKKVSDDLSIGYADAKAFLDDKVRLRNRHRFMGNFMERKGVKGWEKDLDWVHSHYFNMVSRYVAMDEFKSKSYSLFERYFGAYDKEYSGIASYAKKYINDVNGVPTHIENLLNVWINNTPFIGKWLGAYCGDRPAIQLAGGLSSATAIAKLGFFNISSGLMQMSQVLAANAKLGGGIGQYGGLGKWVRMGAAKAVNLSSRDKGIIKQCGLDTSIGMENPTGYSKTHQLGSVFQWSTWAFRTGDIMAKRITVLGAYYKAVSEGKSHAEALQYANQLNREVNYDYSIADSPNIIRRSGPVGQLLFQFKKYPIKTIEFMSNLKGAENVRFWVPFMLLAGILGWPGAELVKALLASIFGWDMENETKKYLMSWAGKDTTKQTIAKNILYGVGSNVGVDVSKRVGAGDFVPNSAGDLAGPFLSSLGRTFKNVSDGAWAEAFGAVSPMMKNSYIAVNGEITGKQDRVRRHYSPVERVLKVFGLRSINEAIDQDKRYIISTSMSGNNEKQKNAISDYLNAEESNNTSEKQKARKELERLGISSKRVDDERKRRKMSDLERTEGNIPKKQQKTYKDLVNFK